MPEESERYTFRPRPEAHAMKWGELMSPLRRAVRDLLLLLEGAVQQVDGSIKNGARKDGEKPTANCFLVYGERGTGKTTVLLSAKEAVFCEKDDFFSSNFSDFDQKERPKERNFWEEAKGSAYRLRKRGAVWLEVLDLESLPPHANMLTTMLTRVLDALDARKSSESKTFKMSSIMEEDADSARHQLLRLINDATVMWEDIREANTRDRANRQIYAADIFSKFRPQFEKAVKCLSEELGSVRGSKGDSYPIILPIDNIDRSTDHLYNIVKLAQMVASPYLWFVLAGDREDVETFLERAYWKELIQIGEGAGGVGKTGIGKEDEALVMARRQAAAASHKLLPPSHRIEVELMRPEETLEFRRSRSDKNIFELLKEIPIPTDRKKKKVLLDMLVASRHCDGAVKAPGSPESEESRSQERLDLPATPGRPEPMVSILLSPSVDESELTHPARLALQLPARGVLDLWQEAERMWRDSERYTGTKRLDDDFRAEKIARTMLQNNVAESRIPSEMGLYLQQKMVQKEPDGTTTLRFCKPNPTVRVDRQRIPEFQRRLYPALEPDAGREWKRYAVRSGIVSQGKEEVLVCSVAVEGKDELELPPVVTGWLLVLHDVVAEAGRSWILRPSPLNADIRFVAAQHEIVCAEGQRLVRKNRELWWPAPQWETCLAHDVLWLRWRHFVEFYKNPLNDVNNPKGLDLRPDYMAWVLAIGWMACVLDTFWALDGEGTGLATRSKDLQAKRLSAIVTEKVPKLSNEVKFLKLSDEEKALNDLEKKALDDLEKALNDLEKKDGSDQEKKALYDQVKKGIAEKRKAFDAARRKGLRECLMRAEKRILTAAGVLYHDLRRVDDQKTENLQDEQVYLEEKGLTLIRDWLERKLPLFLSHLYVPLFDEAQDARQPNVQEFLNLKTSDPDPGGQTNSGDPTNPGNPGHPENPDDPDDRNESPANPTNPANPGNSQKPVSENPMHELGDTWKANLPFIYADYDAEIAEIFPSVFSSAKGECLRPDPRSLGAFGYLYQLLDHPIVSTVQKDDPQKDDAHKGP